MTWVKLDDSFADHPKVRAMSDKALRSHLAALCYAARFRTDGHVPDVIVRGLAHARTRNELVTVGVWDAAPDGIWIHDYLEFQPSRAQIEDERARKVAAGRLGAAARYGKRDRRA